MKRWTRKAGRFERQYRGLQDRLLGYLRAATERSDPIYIGEFPIAFEKGDQGGLFMFGQYPHKDLVAVASLVTPDPRPAPFYYGRDGTFRTPAPQGEVRMTTHEFTEKYGVDGLVAAAKGAESVIIGGEGPRAVSRRIAKEVLPDLAREGLRTKGRKTGSTPR